MNEYVCELWESLRDAGMPEVMLYLTDGSACRCHWDNTSMVGGRRVALLGDQDRGIVRVIPIEACAGIGIPSPKGVDPNGYRSVIQEKLAEIAGLSPRSTNDDEDDLDDSDDEAGEEEGLVVDVPFHVTVEEPSAAESGRESRADDGADRPHMIWMRPQGKAGAHRPGGGPN